ncbi:MAG: polyprenyl synthetase family protein [Alphaproteobacteria bacterium]|nr:polyprenyl synthetase family protein [Alphaproteobacteria bacterium]MBL6672437.1 polyprenyl synthetase family protein [Alphaproteobacteria bacterium]
MTLPDIVERDAATTAAFLEDMFDAMTGPANRLVAAMRYATMNGGKRMRAALVLSAARLAGGANNSGSAVRVAAAIECLHAYSLIHDDLPSMDDAATRRGVAACHVAFDEATAVLAGDALQTLAFGLLADEATHVDPAVRSALVAGLATASGVDGMAGGQMLDLQAEKRARAGNALSLDEIRQMQGMKTGALIHFAACAGGIYGRADTELMAVLDSYSRDLGLAFQIADDCLDHESTPEALGKPAGQDAARSKGSFVSLMGLAAARDAATTLIEAASDRLSPWGVAAEPLQEIARFAIKRRS